MNKNYIAITIIFQLLTLSVSSQEKSVKQILDGVSNSYLSKEQYLVNMTFTMYRGVTGNTISESYTGTMQKKGATSKNQVLDTEIYLFPSASVAINSTTKTITYTGLSNPQKNTPIDLSILLKYYQKSQIIDKGSQWLCEMVTEQNTFNQLPYSKVLLYVNKDDYSVSKQVLYFTNLIPFKNKRNDEIEHDYGRLVIDLKHQWDVNIPAKKLNDFIVKKHDNKIQLQTKYATYKLVDNTEYNN